MEQALERILARAGPEPVLVLPGGREVPGAALAARVRERTAALVQAGFAPGDRVVLAVRPGAEAIALALAVLRAGGVLAPLPRAVGDDVFRARMALLEPRWLLAESLVLAIGRRPALRRLAARGGVAVPPLSDLGRAARVVRVGRPLPGARDRTLPMVASGPEPALPVLPSHAPALVVFTSGTTAAPRAVVHSRGSAAASLRLLVDGLGLGPGDRLHGSDLHLVLPALAAGAVAVLARPATGAGLLAELDRTRPTHLVTTPTTLDELAGVCEASGGRLPASLRVVAVGSAPAHPAVVRRGQAVLPAGAGLHAVYALTEMLPVAWTSAADKLATATAGDRVGRPAPGTETRIVDGELQLRGPQRCVGYLGEPPLGDWLATGDLARLDDDGAIVLLGRRKEMILRRGVNIYPALVEPLVAALPGVRRCALVGLPDGRGDERVVLAVEAVDAAAAQGLADRVRAAVQPARSGLDPELVPDDVVVAEVPVAGRSGKIDRRALARRLAT